MSTFVSVVILVGVLGFALVRPWGLPEAMGAVPGAGLVVLLGLVSWQDAGREVVVLGPTVGFLAAVLTLAHLADDAGVFRYAGWVAGRVSRGSPRRLLGVLFVIASAVTAVLSLDATVVLLTPVVLATAMRMRVRAKPHLYACTHLANSASLLLPVSNLTNLLAFAASGLTFARFAGLMALPWLAVVATEYLLFRWFFAGDLAAPARRGPPAAPVQAPRFALVVLAVTLVGFGLAEPVGVHPAWVAAGGALVLATNRLVRRPLAEVGRLARAANLPFCGFVFGLGIVVLAVRSGGVGLVVGRLIPAWGGLAGLLAVAVLAAVLANLMNNLPATLMLTPLVAHSPGLVLAALLGVNIGPNLTYVGSLATLLWRQILHATAHRPAGREFLRLGALTVPACLMAGVAALWLGLRVSGTS
ncbi:ArsB/NhaD family transporter [Salinispora arenicola]|uniref:ArsB/NhaD family transporter n=1 Tax=Salinispora arenicola TaxID=168697 RepID=UPI0020798356|nr:ArsB/NhaD family transporter [Salinispora arenicola]MCN0151086.1 SLC13 family permease [Salinispora arenicola]